MIQILLDLKSYWLYDASIIQTLVFKLLKRKKREWVTFLHNHSLAGVGSRVGIEALFCSNELSFKKSAISESPGDLENVQALIGPKHFSSKHWNNVIRNCVVVLSKCFPLQKKMIR